MRLDPDAEQRRRHALDDRLAPKGVSWRGIMVIIG
jgi:hypothetical protein